ncbi:recombinase family protein [Pseudovibrio sp. Tun.PSC04-5.I4]|uniref:recombinase family protein n=1 Tax=Pseudovibrio sp. Tun.PSC04-5.I4 TaxID=1798213 RepID=UPI00088EB859|nr:recombinase family protein [Pseudovibrio sp. Tun.PSC04-5.I4]SDR00267.1 Site-specific DNA recombinase [Pseudovibrio sp. Tun.PSC04-5.I4]
MKFGYARVSTKDQNEARQIEALKDHGITENDILIDKVSGATKDRPALDELRAKLREGDEVVVLSMDRLARSLIDLNELVQEITQKEVTVRFIKEGQTFKPASQGKDPMATLMLGVLGSVAQFERDIIKQRQAEGIEVAKAKGVYQGGKPTIDRARVQKMLSQGMNKSAIARELKVDRTSVIRITKELGL